MQIIKTILQILALAISLNTYSQAIVFNELYDMDSLYDSFRAHLELDNGDYIVADQASTYLNEYFGSYIARINSSGGIIWKKK